MFKDIIQQRSLGLAKLIHQHCCSVSKMNMIYKNIANRRVLLNSNNWRNFHNYLQILQIFNFKIFIIFCWFFMDYVRDGDIQGRSLVFLKAHCPCILPPLTQSIASDSVSLYSVFWWLKLAKNKFMPFFSIAFFKLVSADLHDIRFR